ncbi:MAG: radical SAM protein [Candidatus Aminicenantales bacterium]
MKKDRVLLLNPPGDKLYIRDYYCSFSSKASYYWPPQDLIVLSGILSRDFDVHVIDAIIEKYSEKESLDRILSSDYKAVIFTTGTATMKQDFEVMEKVKKARPGTRVLASAGIMKFIGRDLIRRYEWLDGILTDFTEFDIADYLAKNGGLPYKGLLYRRGDGFIESQEKLSTIFEIPVPRHELFEFKKYRIPTARRFPFTVVITSLGCPYNCAFCTAGAFGYRTRKVSNVIEELKYLAGLGVKEILFQDPTLTINTRRVVELCQKMVENGLRFTWSCNADIKSMNEEKISWMKKAGCHTVSVGIESGDNFMLEKYSKPITTETIRDAVRLLKRYKIKILGYFILGLPGETREFVDKTIRLAKSLKLDIASFAIATPDIGTRLREEAIARGWISSDLLSFDSTDFPIIASGELTKEEIWRLRKKAVREFYLRPSYMFRKLAQVRSIRDLKILASNAVSLLSK